MKTIIIAGITRSGLTLTMQMLNAGGYPCFGTYPAFEDYELGKIPWSECIGKAIKVIDTNRQIPPSGEYHVIRLRRNQKQQAKSICKFLTHVCGIPTNKAAVSAMEKSLPKDYKKIDEWIDKQKGSMVLFFEELILNPESAAIRIKEFVESDLDIQKMIACVEKRSTDCFPTMMELKFC